MICSFPIIFIACEKEKVGQSCRPCLSTDGFAYHKAVEAMVCRGNTAESAIVAITVTTASVRLFEKVVQCLFFANDRGSLKP